MIAVGFLGAQLIGLFEGDDGAPVTPEAFLMALVGFILLLVAVLGLFVVIGRRTRPMSQNELLEWRNLRKEGRGKFINQALLKGVFLGIVAISWPVYSDYSQVNGFHSVINSFWIYAAVFIICIFAAYYAAVKIWAANERDSAALENSESNELSL